jgi:hypothetical protein
MVGCIDCNRWTRDGWLYIHLAEEDLAALRADRGPKTIAEFLELQTGWTMLRDDGWYAYYNEEKPLGPFATEAGSGASRAKGVAKRNGPRRLVLGPPPRSRLRVTVVSAFRPGIKRPPRRKTSSTKVAWWL